MSRVDVGKAGQEEELKARRSKREERRDKREDIMNRVDDSTHGIEDKHDQDEKVE